MVVVTLGTLIVTVSVVLWWQSKSLPSASCPPKDQEEMDLALIEAAKALDAEQVDRWLKKGARTTHLAAQLATPEHGWV